MKGTRGRRLELQKPIEDAISRTHFSPNSNNLLISSWDSCLRLYDVDASVLRLVAPLDFRPPLLDCCFQDDSIAFSAASDGHIRRYQMQLGVVDSVGNHDDVATCVQYSDETCELEMHSTSLVSLSEVITSGLDKKVLLWDIRTKKALTCSRNMVAEVDSMSVSGLNLVIASATLVHMYDLRNSDEPVQTKEFNTDVPIKCVRLSPYLKGFAAGSFDGRVTLEMSYSSNSNDIRYKFRCHPKSKNASSHLVSVNDIVFNPLIWSVFVTGDNEGYVTAWDARNQKRLFELDRHSNSISSLSFNHGGDILAITSSYTYQEANELEEPPQIFIHEVNPSHFKSLSAGSSSRSSSR